MKIRGDFVTNSSSSSYVCEVCNGIESGLDLCLSDVDMYECENGHVFHSYHMRTPYPSEFTYEQILEILDGKLEKHKELLHRSPENTWFMKRVKGLEDDIKNLKENKDAEDLDMLIDSLVSDNELDSNYEISAKWCPICQMEAISNDDIVQYLYKKLGETKAEVQAEMKERFRNYNELCSFIRG